MGVRDPGAETRRLAALAACLVAVAAAHLTVYRTDLLAGLGPLRNLAATLLSSLPYALAVWVAARTTGAAWRQLALLLGGVVALRLCIPLDGLVGTDDAYRYLWDGRVLDHGINPFAHPPAAPALAPLREPVFHPHIYRPDMRTVYPPLAQAWFWVAYRLGPASFVGLKLVLLLHECVSALLLWALLRRGEDTPPLLAVAYAWSPLAVVQLQAGAHLDGLLVPWCLLAVLLAGRGRPVLAGLALAAATMVRPLMVLCLPALVGRRSTRQGLAVVGSYVLLCGALVAPLAGAGRGLVQSLWTYARHWRFNGSLFRLAEAALGRRRWLRPALYGAVGVGSLAAARAPAPLPARMLLALGIYFAFAPTVYPWYLVPVAALGALYPGPWLVALPGLVTISDLVFVSEARGGPWQVPAVALWIEYLALYGLAAREVLVRRRHRAEQGG